MKRFWAKVDMSGGDDACWPWRGSRTTHGYGVCFTKKANGEDTKTTAHRMAWTLTNGAIAAGLFACHRCDNPICCNPAHLFLATHRGNMADMRKKGRSLTGDRNPSRRYTERMPRGTDHPNRMHPERMARGERHGHTTLANDDVRSIRARRAAGETGVALAAEYGVSQGTITHIIQRKTWGHIT